MNSVSMSWISHSCGSPRASPSSDRKRASPKAKPFCGPTPDASPYDVRVERYFTGSIGGRSDTKSPLSHLERPPPESPPSGPAVGFLTSSSGMLQCLPGIRSSMCCVNSV